MYSFFRILFWVVFKVIFRMPVTGRERIPSIGPLLVVANHTSFADPPLVAVAIPRRVEFMAMVELFGHPVLERIIRSLHAFPVDRSRADYRAVREAVRRLHAGHCVGIFPEGGIRLDRQSVLGGAPQLRPGTEQIALLSRATILPVIIRGARHPYRWFNWFQRAKIPVTIGCPFCLWAPSEAHRDKHVQGVVREQLLNTVALPY